MKKLTFILILLQYTFFLSAQDNKSSKPFILSGKLTNFSGNELILTYSDNNYLPIIDTISINSDGEFYFKTNELTKPKQANLLGPEIFMDNLFIAPGYDIKIIGDSKNRYLFSRTKKLTGIGSDINHYQVKVDSIESNIKDTIYYPALNTTDLIKNIKNRLNLRDSIANEIFKKNNSKDSILNYFKNIIIIENKLIKLSYLLDYYATRNFNIDPSSDLIKGTDSSLLYNLDKSDYLNSTKFRNILSKYIDYRIALDYAKDSTLKNKRYYRLERICSIFSGKVLDYELFNTKEIVVLKKTEDLVSFPETYQLYFQKINNATYQQLIQKHFFDKMNELFSLQVGKEAISFVLPDRNGKYFSLNDFKGKVIYIDFWASWCAPCKLEMPSLQKIVNTYKTDERIVFISISIDDNFDAWERSLSIAKPDWLQLIDKDKIARVAYAVIGIPRFILIDKNSKIVSFNAPKPSDFDKLDSLLKIELAK
jgi:thiol-disulfide isomerase/thioredoxin